MEKLTGWCGVGSGVAVDDALMGVSTVVRAEEHLTNTIRQVPLPDAPPQRCSRTLPRNSAPESVRQARGFRQR